MSFTFDTALSTDLALIRFHIGDTHEEGHYLDDKTIQYFITAGSVGSAVVACIKYIITQLSTPNFSKDWLSVSNEQARAGYETLLKVKQQEFGISNVVAASTISHVHRADSYENVGGVYTDPDGAQ